MIVVFLRDDPVDPGDKDGRDRRGQHQVHGVDLASQAVDSDSCRADHPAEEESVHAPVDLVDDLVEEDKEGKSPDVSQQGEIEIIEDKLLFEPKADKPDVGEKLREGDQSRDHHHSDRSESHDQQGKGQEGVEQIVQQDQKPLKEESLPGRGDASENTVGKSQCQVDHHQDHEDFCDLVFSVRQSRSEDRADIGCHDHAAS